MPQSESITKLSKALAAAQAEFGPIAKTRTGQEGNRTFKYSDLADVLNEIRPKLNKHGIFLSHPIVLEADGVHLRVTTRVDLEDEFKQSDGIRLTGTEGAGKQLGVENTYARRIDNNNFFGIFPDDDLDAPDLKADAPPKVPVKPPPFAPKPQVPPAKPAIPVQPVAPPQPKATDPITDADLPPFEDNLPSSEPPLSSEDAELADSLGAEPEFNPLSQQRNEEIQGQLRDWTRNKVLSVRSLSAYLDKVHQGKKQFDVSAAQWEKTFAAIKAAVEAGPEAIKAFFKENK